MVVIAAFLMIGTTSVFAISDFQLLCTPVNSLLNFPLRSFCYYWYRDLFDISKSTSELKFFIVSDGVCCVSNNML